MDASEEHTAGDVSLPIRRLKTERASTSNDQDFIPSIPWHVIFVFLDPILLGVLQIDYQNKKESPFDTHPAQMQTFLMAISIYSTLLGIKIHTQARSGYHVKVLSYAILLSGTLSSASLLSILLQRSLFWVVLFIWVSIPVILVRHLLKSSVFLVIEMVAKLTRDLHNCKFAKLVLIFHNKDLSSGSCNTNPADPVEGIV